MKLVITNAKSEIGPLTTVQVGPRSYVRMLESEAQEKGLLPKANKMRRPGRNKGPK